jgi:hypothetical protein
MNPFRNPWRVLTLILVGPAVAVAIGAAFQVVNPDVYTQPVPGQTVDVVRTR